MITFTDERLYVKGTCNAVLYDIATNDVVYQSSKMEVGTVIPSAKTTEVRSGLGNPVAAVIVTDPSLKIEFEAADFQLWAKSAQIGANLSYGAPIQSTQVITATGNTLSVDISKGVPSAPYGYSTPFCFIQKGGAESKILNDGVAYAIDSTTGAIPQFEATAGTEYKVTYYVNNIGAKKAVIGSFANPKVVRFECQIAVYSSRNGTSKGTRAGWIYYTIPCLKLQAEAEVTGDQATADTTKISGQAMAYDMGESYDAADERKYPTLAYLVYVPDDATDGIQGIVVFGGTVYATVNEPIQLPIYFIMADGSIAKPTNYADFNYIIPEQYAPDITISSQGIITVTAEVNIPITVDYYGEYTCDVMIIAAPSADNDNRVGYGRVGYMMVA